jgi:hypothetical protein
MTRVVPYFRRHHLALIALFVALGGSAYAAVQIERNAIKSRHIGPGQVKRSDLGKNAVNSAKVANRSLQAGDFAPGQLPRGAQGPTGPTGASGPTGTDGQDVIDAVGPLPMEGNFNSNGGRLLILASGSAFRSSNTFGEIAMAVRLDGALVDTANFFTNELNSHRTFVDALEFRTGISPGTHTLRLEAVNDSPCGTVSETTTARCTTTNTDDYFEATVIELP